MAGVFEVEVKITNAQGESASGHLEFEATNATTPQEAASDVTGILSNAPTMGRGKMVPVADGD